MTLLAELFDRLDSTSLVATQAPAAARGGVVEVGVLAPAVNDHRTAPAPPAAPIPTPAQAAERTAEPASEPQRIVRTGATASPAWLAARDAYLSHAMTCRACHAPTGRYCPAGAELRATYDNTPMEPTR